MPTLKYQFSLPKKALVSSPKGLHEIGEVKSYSDINGKVFVTIEFRKDLPKEVAEHLKKNPKLISIVGSPANISEAELTDLIEI